ncbi:hypothetical protein [Luteolibacter sp. Populi]|uniref:hypothetical protein n=1 Tax=Luteolibacter sp. Populi TaxID=3230487 RepID=UPI003467BE98
MRKILPGLLSATLLLLASGALRGEEAGEGYVLAKKDAPMPIGAKFTEETSFDMKSGKVVLSTEGEEDMEGTMKITGVESITTEALSPTRYRRIQTKNEETSTMAIAGETVEEPAVLGPLTGVPVILEEKDGKYSATLEAGVPTPEQEKELAEIAGEFAQREDLVTYGEVARKPGDKWKVDPKLLAEFAGAKDLDGSLTVEFVEIKEVGGIRCAVLKSVLDFTGTMADDDLENATMRVQGEYTALRSLVDLMDLETKLEANFTIKGESDGTSILTDGPMSARVRNTLTKP